MFIEWAFRISWHISSIFEEFCRKYFKISHEKEGVCKWEFTSRNFFNTLWSPKTIYILVLSKRKCPIIQHDDASLALVNLYTLKQKYSFKFTMVFLNDVRTKQLFNFFIASVSEYWAGRIRYWKKSFFFEEVPNFLC